MVTKNDLGKLGWRITEEGFDWLRSQWDDFKDENAQNPSAKVFF